MAANNTIALEFDEYAIQSAYPVTWVVTSGITLKTVELVLTNKRILIIEKNVWGNINQVIYYPLIDLKRDGNKIPVSVESTFFEGEVLRIVFNYQKLTFKIKGSISTSKWAYEILTAYNAYVATHANNSVPGMPSNPNTSIMTGIPGVAPTGFAFKPEIYSDPIDDKDIYEGRVALFNINLEPNETILLGSDDVIIQGINMSNPYGMSVMLTDKSIYVEYSDDFSKHKILRFRLSAIKSNDNSTMFDISKGKNGYCLNLIFQNACLTFSFPLVPEDQSKKYINYWARCIKDALKNTKVTPDSVQQPLQHSQPQRKFCINCGSPIGANHRFCANCGQVQM